MLNIVCSTNSFGKNSVAEGTPTVLKHKLAGVPH